MKKRIHLICAARPNFMKVAPLYHELLRSGDFEPILVHTGQHYDVNMSDSFFEDLALPDPHFHLGIGSGSHAEQTGRTMIAFEQLCREDRPDLVLVVGDVNATVACVLAAAKLHIPTVHLEAGLRSRDRQMPEEINRIVTDSISDLLLTPSPDADKNLLQEGVSQEKIRFVGNIMMDSLELVRAKIEALEYWKELSLTPRSYGLVTLHRPSNVDDPVMLSSLVEALRATSEHLALVLPLHPRTKKNLERHSLLDRLASQPNIVLTEPLGYCAFMSLLFSASLVVTDSGGIQEETTYLGIPCLTRRD
ncbi:MAG: UDP-N-acetylglucosamine 2-epimerase (non-hydrolyzing), partial [Bdellovibrionales bacterium]|nr:UDP-N-acetylglucosamine 2-epimerase (non-hydrolyzing) [Bdellovibrionales bacterium]